MSRLFTPGLFSFALGYLTREVFDLVAAATGGEPVKPNTQPDSVRFVYFLFHSVLANCVGWAM